MSSRPVLGPTQPPIKWVTGALSPGIKRPGREADHSSPTSAEVKDNGSIYPLSNTFSCVVLNYLSTGTTFKEGWTELRHFYFLVDAIRMGGAKSKNAWERREMLKTASLVFLHRALS
jgi:hypothetical protein